MKFKNEQIIHLEFAIFCKERNIDVECDADRFHTRIEDIKQYRQGNNILERFGSTELCYPADEIKNNIAKHIIEEKKTVNRYRGIQDVFCKSKLR